MLSQIKNKISKLEGKKEEIEDRIESLEISLSNKKREQKRVVACIEFLNYISTLNQGKIIELFENTISMGLKDLFDDSYKFKFDIKTRGSSSACDFLLQNNSFPGWSNLVMCNGKSVQEIISILFRFALVRLVDNQRKIVILDEPGSGIELERQKIASKILKDVCDNFGIQLIMITHSEALTNAADKEISVNGYN